MVTSMQVMELIASDCLCMHTNHLPSSWRGAHCCQMAAPCATVADNSCVCYMSLLSCRCMQASVLALVAYQDQCEWNSFLLADCRIIYWHCIVSGGTLNTWRSGDDGRTVAERLQVRF
jgi:hypothetical protein